MPEGNTAEATTFEYEDRVLAYVDILGWKDLIERSEKDASLLVTVASAATSLAAHERFHRWRLQKLHEGGASQYAFEMTLFSDTVVLSCRADELALDGLVTELQTFCASLMVDGIYTRGAIVRGKLYHRDGVLFGPALVEAHRLESTVAKYPRILVADTVRAKLSAIRYGDGASLIAERLGEDADGLSYLNVFVAFHMLTGDPEHLLLQATRNRVAGDHKTHFDNVAIRSKLGWLLRVLDQQLATLPRSQ